MGGKRWQGWTLDKHNKCEVCQEDFSRKSFPWIPRRKHHCRFCGRLVHDDCSKHRYEFMLLGIFTHGKVAGRCCNTCVGGGVGGDYSMKKRRRLQCHVASLERRLR